MRAATPADVVVFERFECAAAGNSWDLDVQNQIQEKLVQWTFQGAAAAKDSQALLVLVEPSGEPVAVAAYELYGPGINLGTERFDAVRLYVLAVANEWQGRSFDDGERVSHILMSAVLSDISDRHPGHRVFGRVHKDNVRSLKLLEGYDFHAYPPAPGDDHVYVSTQ